MPCEPAQRAIIYVLQVPVTSLHTNKVIIICVLIVTEEQLEISIRLH